MSNLSIHNRSRNPNFEHNKQLQEGTIHQLLANNITQLNKVAQQVAQKNAPRFDFEYFGLNKISQHELIQIFGQIKFVIVCGERKRAEKIAMQCHKNLGIKEFPQVVGNLSGSYNAASRGSQSTRNLYSTHPQHQRQQSRRGGGDQFEHSSSAFFTIYRVGPILCCNHGMGPQSVSIFLNEVLRMLQLARNNSYSLLRVGSAGGLGVRAGTIVVTTGMVDAITLKPEWSFMSCGQRVSRKCELDQGMYDRLYAIAKAKKLSVAQGKTVATECYYEGQARLDGAICEYSDSAKMDYLTHLHKAGVRNFEMEGTVLSGMCTEQRVPCGMLCVAYLDRLKEDTVPAKYSKEEITSWMDHAIDVVIQYIYQFVMNKDAKNAKNAKNAKGDDHKGNDK